MEATLTETTDTSAIVNEKIQHPEPRHIRMALDTLAAAGTLTPEAAHGLRLAGSYFRGVVHYAAWGELHKERDRHAGFKSDMARTLRAKEEQIARLQKTIKQLRK